MKRLATSFVLLLTVVFGSPTRAQVVMLQPTSASTVMGASSGGIANTINQTGLSSGYSNLVTPFSSYLAGGPTHDSSVDANAWISVSGNPTGNVDFNLGGTYTLERFVLWNLAPTTNSRVSVFTLLASADNTFATTTNLGSFTTSTTGGTSAVEAEVFTLPSTSAAFVRFQITSNSGAVSLSGYGEVAFGVASLAAVPEPSPLVLAGVLGAMGLARRLSSARA